MTKESGAAWPPVHPGAGWGLNLTARRRQYVLGAPPLRVVAPFMALGGRWSQSAARPFGLPAALPWLTPRWLEGPERAAAPARVDEPVMSAAVVAVPAAASPAASDLGQPQAQPPVALALTLQIVRAGPGKPGRILGNFPAPVAPVLSLPSPVKMTVHHHWNTARQEDDFSAPGAGVRGQRTPARAGVGPEVGAGRAKTGSGAVLLPYMPPQSLPYHAGPARQEDNFSAPEAGVTGQQALARAGVGTGVGAGRAKAGSEAGAVLPPHMPPQSLPYHAGRARPSDNLPVPDAGAVDGPDMAGTMAVAGTRGAEASFPPASGLSYGAVPPGLPVFGRPDGLIPPWLPHTVLSWGLPGAFRGIAPGTIPTALYRIMTPAAPGPGAGQAVSPLRSLPPEAFDTPELLPRLAHRPYVGPGAAAPVTVPPQEYQAAPGAGDKLRGAAAPGPMPLQGLDLVMEVISRTVKREVAEVVGKRAEGTRSHATDPADRLGMPADPVSDNLVRLYMEKMRKLAEEERFRLGLLR